jgi:hypothetical protein
VLRSSFVCTSEAGCRTSMLGKSNMIAQASMSKPENTLLYGVLRKKRSDGTITGTQPKSPLVVFHTKTLDRIKTWIQNGATAD